jgi:anti-sigma B factor antagonist
MALYAIDHDGFEHGGRCRLTSHVVGRRTVLAVSGEVDLATSPDLVAAIDAALNAGALELWIDLSETEFMDSSGMHALLDGHARVRELQRRLAVICPPGPVRRVFDISRVGEMLAVYDDRAAAQHAS